MLSIEEYRRITEDDCGTFLARLRMDDADDVECAPLRLEARPPGW